MCDKSEIVKAAQRSMRAAMDKRGIRLKQVAIDAGMSISTLSSYFHAERDKPHAQIPGGAVYALLEGRALPLDLMNLLVPEGFAIVEVPEHIDHDAVSDAVRDYLAAKEAAHRKDSPGGREIADCERGELDRLAVSLGVA